MITRKSPRELEAMRQAGTIIAGLHRALKNKIVPGLDTWEIELFARDYIQQHDAIPSQMGFEGYEYATSVSVNEEVTHAFPRQGLILKAGDIVTVDTVIAYNGGIVDSAWTYPVGEISDEAQRLIDVAKRALYIGIDQAVVGNRVGDIGAAIEKFIVQENGLGNVRDYVGHGIGPTMHEAPNIPHFGSAGHGPRLKEGMTITIEPMVNLGTSDTIADEHDGWTVRTADGQYSAQFEHVIAITADGPKILTSQDAQEDAKYL
jgi:methionyl aminopeptidase